MNRATNFSMEEARREERQLATRRKGMAKVALLVTLGSETVFFGTMISAYLYLRASQPSWPFGHALLAQFGLPVINTLVLLVSAATAALAARSVRKDDRTGLLVWLQVTLVLGLAFIGLQAFEYINSGMTPSDQAFGGVFFTLMGFHALHMVAGVVILALVLARAQGGDFSKRRHTAVDIGTWFWYYVVAVWVVIFSVLYLV
jgi:heme/copper-type cytochrome/quinol oxidase subunit 3